MSECSLPTVYTDIVSWVERHTSKSGQPCGPFARKVGRWHAFELCVQYRVERGYLRRVGDHDSTVAGFRLKVRREAAAARMFFCNEITARGYQPGRSRWKAVRGCAGGARDEEGRHDDRRHKAPSAKLSRQPA
jgi:transposase-like protein